MQLSSNQSLKNKKKIINDPVYGFISLPHDVIFDVIEHPYYQRLRRIKQLGMSQLVYPGALHTRFHHALGATHLMWKALETLRRKGHEITDEEETATLLAILLHDIGHGPFSHTLEHAIVKGISHEQISILFMERLAEKFGEPLELALLIFKDEYKKPFLHQLVSSQLDMDRMDYLNRDSFYTGVSEGVIGSDRIIAMLTVQNDQLMVEEKGIYSVEKFLVARRLMYWQVYMHKTVVASEVMLTKILERAKELAKSSALFGSPAILHFLLKDYTLHDFQTQPDLLDLFSQLDDNDIMGAIKVWQHHKDPVLSLLSKMLVQRKLFKIEISQTPFSEYRIQMEQELFLSQNLKIQQEQASYFVCSDKLTNNAYNDTKERINLLMKNGEVVDITKASDNLNISALSKPVEKYYLCYPRHFIEEN